MNGGNWGARDPDTLAQGLTGIVLQLETMDALLAAGARPEEIAGVVQQTLALSRKRGAVLVAAFAEKYDYLPEVDELVRRGIYTLSPSVVFAWTSFPRTVPRWRFVQD